MTDTPSTDDEREGLARAIEAATNDRNAMAIAALAYLAPIRAREIAAAEARGVEMERARVVAWLHRPSPDDNAIASVGKVLLITACAIERGEHNTGKEG